MTSFFTFTQPVDVDIRLAQDAHLPPRKFVDLPLPPTPAKGGGATSSAVTAAGGGSAEQAPVYFDGETVSGQATVRLKDGKKLVHDGIKVEFVRPAGDGVSRPRERRPLSRRLARAGD
jgi:vacuolar protein sorting-associated protein 26